VTDRGSFQSKCLAYSIEWTGSYELISVELIHT